MSDLNDRLQQARDRIAQSLLPKVADASKAASESRLDTAPKGSNLREHIANGGIVTNNLVNYFNDDAVAKTIKAREELAAQQNDYVGISTANLRSSNPFVSAAANTANLVGGAVGTLAQWANTAAGDEFTAQAIALEAGTPPQMIEAYNTFNKIRSQKQTLAEEHGILLDMLRNKQGDPVAVKKKLAEVEATYKGIVVDPNVEAALSTQIGDETYLDRLDRSQELRHKGVRVQAGSGEGILPAMNVSDFSNPYFKKPLEEAATSSQFVKDTNKEADAAFDRGDYLEGIGKKALSFGAVVGNVLKEAPSNPMGVLQYTAESAPYFALPGVGTAAIVNQTAVEGRNKFEQRTGNALPTTGENLAMLGTDVLYGALNYLGDKGINNAARGITAGVGRTNTQILRDAATGTGQSTISAVGKEAAAEGAQTYLEDSGQNLSTYFNPETVGLGTAIGGLSAGIVSGPGAVVSGAKQASLDRFMNTEEGKAIADQMELAKVPTEELSDITSPKYNPHEVIRRTTNSVKGEDSVATIKETNLAELDKIGAIVDSLDGAIADAESAQAEYVKTSTMLDQLEANDVDGSKAGMIAAARKTLDESNAQNLSVGYEENIKQLQAKKAKADELYLSVREEIIKSNAYLDSLDFVDGVAVNGKPKAASEDTVTNDYISEASGREAARLAQEPDNDYTEEEVSRLRTFSDAVAAANRRKNLNVVGEDIAQGSGKGASKRFKGLGSYLVDAANLVKSGNDRAKKALLNTLTKFSENHESKVAAVKQAFADAQGTDVTIVGKDATTGKWNILDTVSAEDYKANYEKTLAKTGSLGIHSGSNANGFISGMEQESKDIQAVLASVEDTLTTGKLPVHVIAAQGKPKTTESSKGTTKSSTTSKEEKRNPQMEAAYKDVFDKPIGEWDESDFSTIGAQAYDTGSTISTPEEAVKANSFSQKMTKKIIADGIAKNRSTADIMQDVVNVAYSSDFNMKTQGVNALYAYINMRKGLVTEAENKLKGKSTPATKPTAKAPVESKPVLPVIPQKDTVSPEGIVYDKVYLAKDIIALLPDDKNAKHTKYLRDVIAKLIARVPDVTFILAKNNLDQLSEKELGNFSLPLNQITLRHSTPEMLLNFTHELQHAATVFGVRELELPEHAGIKKTVEDLMQVTRKAFLTRLESGSFEGMERVQYALTKLDEFIAVGTTDREVIKFLKSIKLSPKLNVFSSLVGSLGRLFGMSSVEITAYDAVLSITAKAYTLNAARKIADDKLEAAHKAKAIADTKEMLTVKPEKVSKLDSYLFDDGMVAAAEDLAKRFNNDPALTEVKVTKYFDSIQVMDLQDAGLVNAQESMSREQWQAYEAERLKRLEAATPSQDTPAVIEDANQIPVETKLEVALQGYTNHSGGAKGYDAEWDIIGSEFGFNNNNHYLLPVDGDVADPRLKAKGVKPVDATKDIGQVAATGQATGEAQVAVTEAERLMGRIAPNHTTRNTKKIRNYAQVKNADGIFAIGSLIPKGTEITIAQGKETRTALVPQVNGGTSVAVQLGIMMGKPTYVFNQVENDTYAEGWHKWDAAKEDFVPTGIPVLTKNFAGVGTSSNTTEQGKQAIRDVYQKTLDSLNESESKTTGTSIDASNIYDRLNPSKTVTENVALESWSNLKYATEAITDKAVISTRIKGSNEHFGNPFSSTVAGLIKTKSTEESVVRYLDWILSETTDINPEQHAWIREQLKSQALVGKPILYYKELGEPSHANALDYLINTEFKVDPEVATETQTINPEYRGKVILAHAGTGKSFATKSNPDIVDGDVLYYQATNTIIDKYNKANGENVPKIKDVTGTRGVFDAWGEYGDKAAIQALEVLKVSNKNVVGELSKVTPADVAKWKKSLLGGDSDTKAIATLEKYLANKTEIDRRKAEAIRRRNEIYQEYANQARALADSGKTVLSSSIRPELVAVADIVIAQNDVNFIAKNLTSSERVNQNSEVDLGKIQKKIDKAIRVEGELGNKGKRITLKNLGDKQFISDLLFGSDEVIAESVIDEGVSVHGKPKLMSKPIREIDNELPVGGMSVFTGAANVTPRERQAAQAKIINSPNTTETKVVAPIKRKDGSTTPGRTTKIEISGLQKANLVVASFYQKAKSNSVVVAIKDFFTTHFSNDTSANEFLDKFLGRPATPEELNLIRVFRDFHTKRIQPNVRSLLTGYAQLGDFKLTDYLTYLFPDEANPSLDENIVTAISAAAFSFLLEKSGKFTHAEEDVAELLGLDEKTPIPHVVMRRYQNVGSSRAAIVSYLGRSIFETLSLKVQQDATEERKQRMINAFGSLAYNIMAKEGLLQVTEVLNSVVAGDIARVTGQTTDHTVKNDETLKGDHVRGFTTYARVAYDTKTKKSKRGDWLYENNAKLRPDIQEYKDAARGVSSVLNNLFGITNVDTAPLFKEPKGLNQASTDQLGTQVPSALKDNTEQMMKKKYVPNGDTYKAMLHLRDNNIEALEAMIGVVSDEDIAKMHVTQRSSVISTNEGLRRSLENGLAFVSSVPTTEGQYAPIYLPMKVWVLNRVGVTSNLFNEQGDKVHRALTVMSQHVQTIAATQPLVNGEISLVGRALLGAAAYMEEITLSIGKVAVDKTAASVYLPALMEYLSLDRVSSAIASYGKLQDGTATMEDITAVRDLVIEFGGGAMSLASVNVLYQLSTIKDGKATLKTEGEVTTNVAIGSDGVTNGMALSMLVYGIGRPRNKQGATVNSLHNAAGYFYVGDKQETLMAYRSSGADDLYQQLARIQKDLWNTLVTNNRNPVEQAKHAALAFFDPKFGERAGAKVGLVPFVYGSGFTSIKAAQSRAFISSIYATMAKLASSNGGNPTTASIVEFDTHLSALLGKPETFLMNAVLAAREGLTVKEELIKAKVDAILETELTRNMIDKITEVESGIRGTITQNAMKVMSGDLIAARGRVNNLASLGFDIFKGLFDFTRDETLKNLESQGLTKYRVAQNGDRITLEGLTVKQMDRLMADLNKYGPVVVSVAGTYSTNPVESAHAMYIVTKVPQTAELPVSKLHIKTQFDIKHTPNSATVPTFSNFESPLYTITIEYRGPANNASIVQAMDAWVTTQVSSKFDALNHHDENASGVTEAVAMAQFQNKVLFDAALQYGVYKEVLRGSLFRPLRGIIKYGESSTGKETDASSELARRNFAVELSKGTFSSLKQYADENFNIKNKTSYSDLLKAIVTAMYDVEVNKVSALKGLSAISQYSLEGGEYKITPRDKQAIEDKIAALKEELALDLEVATKLGKDLDKLYFSTITTPKAQAKPEVVRTIGSNGRVTQRSTKKIKFRRAGDQSNILNPVYLGNDFLVVNDGIVDVAASIANIDFSGTYMDSALGKAMLKLILSSLPKGLTVQYLTPDNVTPDMAKALVNPNAKDSAVDKLSRGDSWYYNNNIVIAVDGRGHAVSLIHELVHAVTSATVGIGGDPNTIDAFTRLSDRLKEYAADNAASISPHTLKKIEYATGKLSEFITVMLTEQDVFELARKIPTSLKTRTRSANTKGMATLLKDFLTVIADYFRSKVNAAKDSLNGMESLLESTLVIATDAMQLNKTYFDSGTSEDFEGELDNDLDNKKADAVRLVTEFRAQEVFEALPSSGDLEADQRLSALMLSIIDSTYTPISNSRANTTYTPNEVWGKAISEGRTPYGTGAIAAGFELSQRELFAIEALEVTVKGVIDSGIVSPAYKELLKVFDTAKTVLSAKDFHKGDWSKATEHQKEVAEAKHRYLFNIAQSANGRSDFMSKFVAMALGSHEVHALLTFSEKKAKAKDSTLLSKIEAMYEHALRWVSGYLTNTFTYQQAKNKLPILVRNLVDIDHKKRDQAVGNVFDKLNVGVGKLDKFIKERGKKLDASLTKLVDGTKYPRIAGVTKTAGIIAGGRAMDLLDLAQQYRDLANPGKPLGWKAEILNEMATPSKAKQAVLRLLRRYTLIQTGRKNHSSTTVEALLESFADGGMKLSKSDKEALTYGVLRTDMQVLFSKYGRIGLRRLLSSPQFLDQRIQELEVDVTDPLHRVRVKDLAFYMTTGETNDMLAENALSIARNVGMQTVMKESEVDPEYLSKLDELISLRALEYLDTHHKDSLIKIMDIENARTEGSANGVETLMRYHKRIQEDAKDALYEGNTTAFVKGYIPDITDPHREIKVVTTEAERKQMKDMGYTFVRAYRSHPSEPGGGTRYVYVTEASSKTRYVSGAVSMTGKVKNGTSIFANSDLSYVGEHNVIRRETDLARERILNINPSSYDPRVDGTRGVAPTYSNGGTIIDFRYVHSHATKDSLLSRNNNFAKVLGAFAGSNFDKVSTSDHNKAVIDVITADYQENYTRYPRSFVEVGPDSPDPRVRAMYFMLPEDTRNYVQSIWGKGTPMYIRNTLLLPLFGTSKYTIGLAFDKNPELRNLPERIITGVFSAVFKDTAKLRALQAETLNQSLVSWYKSTVVIRNLTTLMGNQASNTGILLAMNVPATDIYRNSVLAYRAGMDYMSDTRELIRAQNAMNTGIGNAAVHLQTIRKHSDSLARNPLKEFLDAGMLTTIVEDVSLEINDYEYKSRLEQKIDDQLDKLNPTIRKIGATLLVAPSTELYQKLATLTQLSDFTAKYVLYSHMRNKSEEKLSHEDALALADTIFINYDVPTSMELQYGNDMGFLMFTKYTLRVQRAMAYLIKNHKGGLFAQHLLANTLGMPAATIPLFINQLGNPLQPGGLGAVGALNQPLPIKMLLGGIN